MAEAEGVGGKVGRGEAGAGAWSGCGVVGMGGEGLAAAAEVRSDGRDSAVFDCETEMDGGGALGEALLADGLEELRAVAEEELRRGDGIPEDVAKATQGDVEGRRGGRVFWVGGAAGSTGYRGADGVPIGGEGLGEGGAQALEAGGVGGEVAGVESVEGEGGAGSEGRGQVEDGLRGFAGVIGVGVDDVLGDGKRGDAGGCDEGRGFPMQGGGDLEGDAGEGLAGDVAQGDAGTHGEMAGGGGYAGVEVVGGEDEAGALLVGEDGAGGGLAGGMA